VYVKGVGLGRGVSAATKPSGVCSELGADVDVRKGMRVEGGGVESTSCEAHPYKKKKEEIRRRKVESKVRCMRRL